MSSDSAHRKPRSEDVRETLRTLKGMAVNGLLPMFDPQSRLFCFKLRQTATGLVREGLSRRYTMITLMGLHRLEESGERSPINIRSVFKDLVADTDWVDNIGDLGLLLWLCSLMAPERLPEINERLEIDSALTRFRDARTGRTTELAWFLAGLAHECLVRAELLPVTRDLAFETYGRLLRNQGEHGIFGHLSRSGSLAGMLRSRIGNFADQVYPIYALSKFFQAYGEPKAAQRALECALTICQAQGSLGQWWWHYDSATGNIVNGFPVFSVHQHGMGPMTLLALGEAMARDFTPWIHKGLQWIEDNELDCDMKDASANLIWRCIFQFTSQKYWKTAISILTKREDRKSQQGLNVLYECRPYELGWLLYAFAGKNGQ